MSIADSLESWVCQSCLADAANVIDSDEDDLEFNFPQESEQAVTSKDVNHVCPVCTLKSIPVNGEHVCTVSKKAVMHGVVTRRTLQALQILFVIIVFQINTNKDNEKISNVNTVQAKMMDVTLFNKKNSLEFRNLERDRLPVGSSIYSH